MLISNIGKYLKDQERQKHGIGDNKQYPSRAVEAPVVMNYEKAINAQLPPAPDVSNLIRELKDNGNENKRKKYEVGTTKEEIYHNIINKKPSVNNVRQELSAYADLIMDEDLF